MDERKDLEQPNQKNIAQLLVKLATVEAQVKLVKSALFLNRQRATISNKIKDFKEYAEGQAEKYSQNMEDANKAIENYENAVQEAMKEYEKEHLEIMQQQDSWQKFEIDKICEMKEHSSKIREIMKTPEYKDWKQTVKAKEKEIKQNAGDPEKITVLAEELKQLQEKDPTSRVNNLLKHDQQQLESVKHLINIYDERLEKLESNRDENLNNLLENKETSLAKIQKQSLWQKIVARLTPKAKSFKTNVVDKIADQAVNIKKDKIPQIKQEISAKKREYEEKISDFKENLSEKFVDTMDNMKTKTKDSVKAVVDFGRESKKEVIRKVKDTKNSIKEKLETSIKQKSNTLEELNEGR